MDDAKGFQAISAKALMKVLEKYEKSDRTSQAENIANGFVGRGDAQNHAEVSTNLKTKLASIYPLIYAIVQILLKE